MLNNCLDAVSGVATPVEPAPEQDRQVYVIDGDIKVRRFLHTLLSTTGFVSWQFASGTDFLNNLAALKPAPILLDMQLPDEGGLQLITRLSDRGISWPVIVMTSQGNISDAVRAMKLGAIEYLEKPFEFELLEACLQVGLGRLANLQKADEIRSRSHCLFDLLSQREAEVIMALMDGMSNKIAAYRLSLSVRTVEMHRANALAKLKVKSMAEVVRLANNAGIALRARS
jgi:two-component system, LuxR family, response regulator FixJ